MSVFTQIIILFLVLTGMVMMLLAIRQLTRYEGFENSEDTKQLREEVNDDSHILSHNNIFHNLVEIDVKEEDHKSNSNDPLSRKE